VRLRGQSEALPQDCSRRKGGVASGEPERLFKVFRKGAVNAKKEARISSNLVTIAFSAAPIVALKEERNHSYIAKGEGLLGTQKKKRYRIYLGARWPERRFMGGCACFINSE